MKIEEKDKQANVQEQLNEQHKALEQQQKTIEEHVNQLKRLQAEFENYVKRNERERAGIAECAVDHFLTKLLVIVDDFHQALMHIQTSSKEELAKGMELMFAKLHKLLESEGVRSIDAKGKLCDPNYHEVILSQITSDVPENTVLEELQKGYVRKDRVLRYTKVKVSKKQVEA